MGTLIAGSEAEDGENSGGGRGNREHLEPPLEKGRAEPAAGRVGAVESKLRERKVGGACRRRRRRPRRERSQEGADGDQPGRALGGEYAASPRSRPR